MFKEWRILPNAKRLTGSTYIFITLFFFSTTCWAGTWQQSFTAKISEVYDTNPSMSPTSPGAVTRSLLEPNYKLIGRLGENDELKTGLAFQIARSSNPTLSPNRNSPNLFVDWSHPIETGEFGVLFKYAEIATLDAGIDSKGQATITSTRESRYLSGRWSKDLSTRSSLAADASYENVLYTGDGTYVDYATRSESIKFSYVWNELSTPFIKLSHTDYEPSNAEQSSQTNTVQSSQFDAIAIGLTWKTSDNLEGSLQTGKSINNNEEMSTQSIVAVQYTAQRAILAFQASRQILPSGIGGFITTDQASVNWNYALSERSKTGIDFGWRNNHLATEVLNQTSSVWLQTDITTSWGLRTYYQHNTMQRAGIDNASSNILGITLSYTNSDF